MDAAEIIMSARTRAHLSKRELARRVGTSPAAIVEYESGRRSPTVDSLDSILNACGFDVDPGLVARAEMQRLERCGRALAELLELVDHLPSAPANPDRQWPLLPRARHVGG